jgi:hypothetical protein
MSDPRRLDHEDAVAGALLRAARAYRPPARAARRVRRMLGLPVALSLGVSIPAAIASSTGLKVLAVATMAAVAGGGGLVAYRQATNHPPRSVESQPRQPKVTAPRYARPEAPMPAPAALPPVVPATLPPPTMEPARPAVEGRRPGRRPTAPQPPSPEVPMLASPPALVPPPLPPPPLPRAPAQSPLQLRRPALAGELVLLEAGDSAIERRQFRQALAHLDEYRRQFPDGALLEEATVLRIKALLGAGDRRGAEEEAGRFLSRFGQGLLAGRVRSMLSKTRSHAPATKGEAP